MNIQELHIGLDLGLQKVNSNVFEILLREEKDYYLNVTIKEIVRSALLGGENTIFDIATYRDIRNYYETLQYYIRQVELNLNSNSGERFKSGNFPTNIPMGTITTGVLYKDIPYKVLVPDGIDLSVAGGSAAPSAGYTFVCSPANLTGGNSIVTGETYRIVNPAGQSFSAFGAPNNNPGTVFTATSGGALGAISSIVVERLTVIPPWENDSELTPTSNFGYFNYLSSRSSIRYGQSISSGTLTVGKKYYVYKSGTTDLTDVGGKVVNSVGFIFTCISSDDITWEGGTILYEVLDAVNRIVKFQDVYNFLEHSYGSAKSKPIATLSDNKLQVYHDFKFDIYRIYLDYVKEPVTVSLENNVDTDLPVSMHTFLVDTTVKYIQSAVGGGNNRQPQTQNQQ